MPISWQATVRPALAAAILALLGSAAGAETIALRGGDNLAEAVRRAADGDVIRLEPGRYSGPVIVEGKRIVIEGPSGGQAVIVPGRSNVLVGAQKDGQVELSGLKFETSAETPIALFAKGGGIRCADCTIESAQNQPVYIESGTLALTGSKVSGAGNDVIVASGSAISLEGTQVEAPKGSPLRMVGATKVAIVSSRLSGHESTVISGSALQLRIVDSEIATHQSYGFYFEGGGEIEIERSRMNGGGAGLVAKLGPSAQMRVSGLEARSPEWGIYLEHLGGETPAEVTLDDVRAVGGRGVALRAIGAVHVTVKNSVIASGGAYGVSAERHAARLTLEKSVIAAEQVPVIVSHDGTGRIDLVDSVIFPEKRSDHGVIPDDDTQRLSRAITEDAALVEELKSGIADFLGGGASTRLEAAVQKARETGASISMVGLEVVDGAGKARAAPFNVVHAETLEVVAESENGAPVPVPPGFYIVELREDALLTTELEVNGGSATARIEIPEALWLDANLEGEESRVTLFRPIAEEKVREVFSAAAFNYAFHSRISRRAKATDADVEAALDVARRFVSARMSPPKENGTQAEWDRYIAWSGAVVQALKILAKAGTADDVALIAEAVGAKGTVAADTSLMHLAYLEQRLGLLANGRVAAYADGQDPNIAAYALVLLDYYGVAGAKERLFALAADGELWGVLQPLARERIAQRLIGLDDPRVGEIASAALQRALEHIPAFEAKRYQPFLDELTRPFFSYLAVFGSTEEKRTIIEVFDRGGYWKGWLARPLAMIAIDPRPFIEEFTEQEISRKIIDTSSPATCALWRLRDEAELAALYEMLIDANARYWRDAVRKNTGSSLSEAYAIQARTARLLFAPCRPDEVAADVYYKDKVNSSTVFPGNWFPAFRTVDALREVMTKRPFDRAPLEAAPVDIGLTAWQQLEHVRWSSFRDERMAMYRAFTKSGDDEVNGAVDDGIERRVYVLRHVVKDSYSGAINGHLEVRPMAEGGKLVIGVRLRQAAWYNSFGGIADMIATGGDRNQWAHHAYVVDGGRKLIEHIALHRDGTVVPLVEEGRDAEGFFRFTTDLSVDDLSRLVLEIRLALFEDRRSFQFDVFASKLARNRPVQ